MIAAWRAPADQRPTVTPGLRRLWRIAGCIVAVVTLVWGTGNVMSLLGHEEETVVTSFDAAGLATVDVDNQAGPVEIVASDDDEVTVTAEVSDGMRDTRHDEQVVGDRLEVRGSCPVVLAKWCGVSYTLTVPADVDVRVRGKSGITVRGVAGDVDVVTDNGAIDVARLSGDVRLETDNGSVEATGLTASGVAADSDNGRVALDFAEPPRSVTATSDNGSIEVVLPDVGGVAYRVDADSRNGAVSTLVDTSPDGDRTVTADSDNGSVIVRYP